MKKQIVTALMLTLSLCLSAQNVSVITGCWKEKPVNADKIGLYQIENCSLVELGSSRIDADGSFVLAFAPKKEGFYAMAQNPQQSMYRYIFYFKPGDNLSFEINGDDYTLTGKNTPENLEIAKWQDLVYPIESKAIYFFRKNSTYKDFFPTLADLLPQIKAYPKAKTGNKLFDAAFEEYKKVNLYEITLTFTNTPRSAHPEAKDYPNFYRELSIADISATPFLLNYPGGIHLFTSCKNVQYRADTSLDLETCLKLQRESFDLALGEIIDNTLKGEYMLANARTFQSYPGLMDYKAKYGKYLITEDQQKRFRDALAKVDKNETGNVATNFKFPDINGKEVFLTDFKGKLVYIDIWATWCAPCKGEIPFLKELEEQYRGKNIEFVSVSVDKEKDKQKWLDMVKEKELSGVQLFAGARSEDISVPYNLKGIPRFILVGADGNLISGDAPRPSSKEIKVLLDTSLK
ncbi:TlpA family protein disulfide reductase [Bacteroides reticulotermitis]|uniref:Thioredoxin domain-containing protein n=3 Tax=Bacteroides reticulotermitis TaxID=1133319 RepID=W4V071_9BACE|nr:TlpA disulfide reductase family protein [Bacteroides reticulotermitis]MBB4044141.1 thiol-disulfide isomerase/thioredoxin [Bacteroides reticulotermitis]GAE86208.1 hypothetical protein JCM10512_4703 [Bacteroides reticulotermitis JCM 10512]